MSPSEFAHIDKIVQAVSYSHFKRDAKALGRDDLYQQGWLIALMAREAFDGRGSKFAYIYQRVRWGLVDYTRCVGVDLHHHPERIEVQLEEPIGERRTLADVIPSPARESSLDFESTYKAVERVIERQKPRYRSMFRRIINGETSATVARAAGCTEARVAQILPGFRDECRRSIAA